MNAILEKLKEQGKPAFRTREFSALLGNKAYASQVLHRLKEKKELISIKQGIWAFPDASPEAIACEIFSPCYISFHSAIYLHGLTTQIPKIIQLAVLKNNRNISIYGTQVKKYKIKEFNGFFRKDNLLIASKEKAIADSINYPKTCPEIVLKEAITQVNTKKVKLYLNSKAARIRFRRLIKNVRQE